MKAHLQPVAAALPVILDECEYVAAPFAIPVLPGAACVQFLGESGGTLPDVASIAQVLHHQADLGSDSQGLYLFPRVIDAATLARLLQPEAQQLITEAMVADAIETASGANSRLVPLIPEPDFRSAPLMFLLGAVFRHELSPEPLELSRPGWWLHSRVRQACESMFCGQFAERGIPMTLSPMPHAASGLQEALHSGVVDLLAQGHEGLGGEIGVVMENADTVNIAVKSESGSSGVSLPMRSLGETFVEEVLNALAQRVRFQAADLLH